jgi:hypothetical protein
MNQTLTPDALDHLMRTSNLRDALAMIKSQAAVLGIISNDMDALEWGYREHGEDGIRKIYMSDQRGRTFRDHILFVIAVLQKQKPRDPLDAPNQRWDDMMAEREHQEKLETMLEFGVDPGVVGLFKEDLVNPAPGKGSRNGKRRRKDQKSGGATFRPEGRWLEVEQDDAVMFQRILASDARHRRHQAMEADAAASGA